MNYQLCINGVPSKIVCVAPSAKVLQMHLDDVGGIGYNLYEIVSAICNVRSNGFESWSIYSVEGVKDLAGFSILQYSLYSTESEDV